MKIGLIGSGRMAQAMGGYLRDRGYEVRGLWGRNPKKAREAARYLEIEPVEDLADLIFRADILLLAVSDDALQSVGNEAALCGTELEGKWVGHFSGSLSLDVLEPLTRKGARGFSLHPLQTIPEPDRGRKDLSQATFMLEAEEGFRDSLKAWLVLCGNTTAWIEPGKKGLYHLGACLASNYVMTLYRLAEEALIDSGVPETAAAKALFHRCTRRPDRPGIPWRCRNSAQAPGQPSFHRLGTPGAFDQGSGSGSARHRTKKREVRC